MISSLVKCSRYKAVINGAIAKPTLPPTINKLVAKTSFPLGAMIGTIPPAIGWNPDEQIPDKKIMITSIHAEEHSPTALAKMPPVIMETGNKIPRLCLSAAIPIGACKKEALTWKSYKAGHTESKKGQTLKPKLAVKQVIGCNKSRLQNDSN